MGTQGKVLFLHVSPLKSVREKFESLVTLISFKRHSNPWAWLQDMVHCRKPSLRCCSMLNWARALHLASSSLMSSGSCPLDASVTQYSAVRSDISWCVFSGVCGMTASWESGAQGPVKWLCESVIDWALSVANGIDELCQPDGEGIGSCTGSEM